MENIADNIEKEFIEKQKSVCKRFNTDFLTSPFNKIIGAALKSFDETRMPINGMRHPIENEESASWYIWPGEFSNAHDFFQPVHISHLLKICSKAINYLGLPPEWRFLFDNDYEDVWYNEALLSI
jgi:hypothetical protein